MKAIKFLFRNKYIIYLIILISLIITLTYLNEKIFYLKNEPEYIKRCLFIHSIYISFFILLFSVLLANSLSKVYYKVYFIIRIILKIAFLLGGIVYLYVFLGFTSKLFSEPDVDTKRLYECLMAVITGLSLGLSFLYNCLVIPLKKNIKKENNSNTTNITNTNTENSSKQ